MTLFLEIATLLAVADDGHLSARPFSTSSAAASAPLMYARADGRFRTVIGKEYLSNVIFAPALSAPFIFNIQNAVLRDNVLFAASFDDSYLGHKSEQSTIYPTFVQETA